MSEDEWPDTAAVSVRKHGEVLLRVLTWDLGSEVPEQVRGHVWTDTRDAGPYDLASTSVHKLAALQGVGPDELAGLVKPLAFGRFDRAWADASRRAVFDLQADVEDLKSALDDAKRAKLVIQQDMTGVFAAMERAITSAGLPVARRLELLAEVLLGNDDRASRMVGLELPEIAKGAG